VNSDDKGEKEERKGKRRMMTKDITT